MTKKRRRPVGETIGGILVGFDQQILSDLPPAQELVQQSRPLRGLVGLGDGREIVFPDDDGDATSHGGDDDLDQPAEAVASDEAPAPDE
jgi:hypothetical protein